LIDGFRCDKTAGELFDFTTLHIDNHSWHESLFHAIIAAPLASGKSHHGNRQDAREGGEIPPLPRNCERPRLNGRRIGRGRKPAWPPAYSEVPKYHWRQARWAATGKVLAKA
jgi:hypothetical protein